MNFLHCDNNEQYLTLHDCITTRAYLEDGKLGFEFADGFWVSPDHPESQLAQVVRTDASRVEYTLQDGKDYDVSIYVFDVSRSGKITGAMWELQELLDNINGGKCKLEFIYQYTDFRSRMVECMIHTDEEPYHQTCIMKISAPEVSYYWNNLREDRVW